MSGDLEVMLLQLNRFNHHATVAQTVRDMQSFMTRVGPTIIKDMLDTLTAEQLHALHNSMNSHTDATRISVLAKQVFNQHMQVVGDMKKAMELLGKSIEVAVYIGFITNYGSENGNLEWAPYTAHIVKATRENHVLSWFVLNTWFGAS